MKRRTLLKNSLATTTGLLCPGIVMASYPNEAFESKDVAAALSSALGSSEFAQSDQIMIKAPNVAENGSLVPIQVRSNIANTDSITLVVESNSSPFVATFVLHGSDAFVSTRIKMADTGNILAIAKAGGVLHATKVEIKVTTGGCGG